jgi:hypothetical protein
MRGSPRGTRSVTSEVVLRSECTRTNGICSLEPLHTHSPQAMELIGKGLAPGLVIPQPKIVFIALLHRKIVNSYFRERQREFMNDQVWRK